MTYSTRGEVKAGAGKPRIKFTAQYIYVTWNGQTRIMDLQRSTHKQFWRALRWHIEGWMRNPQELGYCNGIDWNWS